jgi:dolichol-phosphate mannosyltransferase
MTNKKTISIIVPSHNEEKNVVLMHKEITKVWKSLGSYNYEIIYIDDGSQDKTWEEIKRISQEDSNVKGINFSKNFGHQAAIEAGLKKAKGEAVIMMDADLQHPAYLIPTIVKKWEEGYEIVNTKRINSGKESLFKRLSSWGFYKLINSMSSLTIEEGSADFRLLDRKVVNELNKITEKDKFYRGLVNWIGFKSTSIEYVAGERINGKTSYSLRKMITFARVGITSFSMLPMKIIMAIGIFLFTLGSIGFGTMLFFRYFIDPAFFSGSVILSAFIIMNNGFLILVLGIISTYQIVMMKEIQNRPTYIVREEVK